MEAKKNLKKARGKATEYLVSYVGEKAVTGTPRFDTERKIWFVPVLFQTSRGIFLAGKIELDERFEIVFAPSKSELTRMVEVQLKRLPSIVYADKEELEAKGFEVAILE